MRPSTTKLFNANKIISDLEIKVNEQGEKLQSFITNDASTQETQEYRKAFSDFRLVENNSFEFSLHGNKFKSQIEFVALERKAIIKTYAVDIDLKNHPNLILTHIPNLDVLIDTVGNVSFREGGLPLHEVGLDYFGAVVNHIYPV